MTARASVGGAIGVLATFLLNTLPGVEVPPEVGAAISTIAAAIATRLGLDKEA